MGKNDQYGYGAAKPEWCTIEGSRDTCMVYLFAFNAFTCEEFR